MSIEEVIAVKEKWAKVQVPNKGEIQFMKNFAHHLGTEIDELVAMQPKCWLLKEGYDEKFSSYKLRVNLAIAENKRVLQILDDSPLVESRLSSIQSDIEFLRDWQTRNYYFMREFERKYIRRLINRLKKLKMGFEQLADEKIEGRAKLREEFDRNGSILKPLLKHSHKWKPIETHKVIIKPEYIPPDWSSKKPRKEVIKEFVTRRKCEKCSKEEKVDFRSDLHF